MSRIKPYVVLAAVVCALLLIPRAVFAHEHRIVGKYEFVVGFLHEPAYVGEQNGIWVKISDKDTHQPIEKLADSLKAQVRAGSEQRDLPLIPTFGEKGVYSARFYPTSAGDYAFRFTGAINGASIDEQFTSSPSTFDSVKSTTELQFPAKVPSSTQLSTQLAEIQSQTAAAQNAARTAMLLGGTALGAGLLGICIAVLAIRRRHPIPMTREAPTVRAAR